MGKFKDLSGMTFGELKELIQTETMSRIIVGGQIWKPKQITEEILKK